MIRAFSVRERYMRDSISVRLGALAANLARIDSFADRQEHGDTVRALLKECGHFIEWTVTDADSKTQVQLVELQRWLGSWDCRWHEIWGDPRKQGAMRVEAASWSARILEHSGLLSGHVRDGTIVTGGG